MHEQKIDEIDGIDVSHVVTFPKEDNVDGEITEHQIPSVLWSDIAGNLIVSNSEDEFTPNNRMNRRHNKKFQSSRYKRRKPTKQAQSKFF